VAVNPRSRRFQIPVAFPLELAGDRPGEGEPGDGPGNDRTTGQPAAGASVAQGVYVISVASRILHMHPQTLRKYERLGLVSPSRSGGMLRLYSVHDIGRLRMIKHLVEDRGMNLAGVEMALEVVARLLDLRALLGAVLEGDALDAALLRLDDILRTLRFAVGSRQDEER
jgi:DNA-binding transcriptional MerR regulator